MAKKQPSVKEVDRSAKTGKFVSEEYAKKHPATTEHERYKEKSPSKKK